MIKCCAMALIEYRLENKENASFKEVFMLLQKFFYLWGKE